MSQVFDYIELDTLSTLIYTRYTLPPLIYTQHALPTLMCTQYTLCCDGPDVTFSYIYTMYLEDLMTNRVKFHMGSFIFVNEVSCIKTHCILFVFHE